ncbi:MAG: hypothetical protein Kow0069_18060 [Promethearchaeota archaeon]
MAPSVVLFAISVTIAVNLVIFLLSFRRYVQTKIRGVLFLSLLNVTVMAYEAANWLTASELYLGWFASFLVDVSPIFPVFMGLWFVLFLDSFSEERVVGVKTAFVTFFLGAMTVVLAFPSIASAELILNVIGVYFLVITLWTYRVLNTSLAYVTDLDGELQIKRIKVGLLVAFLGTAFVYGIDTFVLARAGEWAQYLRRELLVELVSHVTITVGTVLIAAAYIANPRIAVVQPQRMYKLFLINESGLPLFSYEFTPDVGIDETLVSGALSAITNLMQEAVGAKALDLVRFGDRSLLVAIKGKLAAVLITDQPSSFLREGLRNFLSSFLKEFAEVAERWTGAADAFKGTDVLIERAFGLRVAKFYRAEELSEV